MQYKNPLTKALLKEFRKFQKWQPSRCYVFDPSTDGETVFNDEIRAIIRRFDQVSKTERHD